MKNFRGQLPLTEADFSRIRAEVLARTRRRQSTAFAFRWAFAVLVLAFVIIALWPERPSSVPTPIATATTTRSPSPAPIGPIPTVPAASAKPAPPDRIANATPLPRRTPRKHLSPVAPQPPLADIRMEIQTSDPDIRIIWLPNHETQTTENRS